MSAPDTPAATPPPPSEGAPIDPDAYAAPRRGIGAAVWILLAVGLLSVIAGLAVATLGPRLFPVRPLSSQAEPPQPPVSSVDARLADIQARLAAQSTEPRVGAPVAAETIQVEALSARLDRIERRQQAALDAAAAALAVASLDQAAQGAGGFAPQLAAVQRFLPDSAEVRGLAGLATGGAPSRAALAAEFPAVASRAAAVALAGRAGDGLGARVVRALASVITIRRVDRATGPGADAILVRAETKAADGDLDGALAELTALPPAAGAVVEPWRERARRRTEIDRHLAAIRAQALQRLARGEADAEASALAGTTTP